MSTTKILRAIENLGHYHGDCIDSLVLPYEQRVKGRFKAQTSGGVPIGVFLERGKVLCEGDGLKLESGDVIRVSCQPEALVEARCDDWNTFARCCYHLGNRHVPLQVGEKWLRFQPDHVLQEMVQLLGMVIEPVNAAFHPEQGAYAGGHHHH